MIVLWPLVIIWFANRYPTRHLYIKSAIFRWTMFHSRTIFITSLE